MFAKYPVIRGTVITEQGFIPPEDTAIKSPPGRMINFPDSIRIFFKDFPDIQYRFEISHVIRVPGQVEYACILVLSCCTRLTEIGCFASQCVSGSPVIAVNSLLLSMDTARVK